MRNAANVTMEQISKGFKTIGTLTKSGAKRVPTAGDIVKAKELGIDLQNPKSIQDRLFRMAFEQGAGRKPREASCFKNRKATVRTEEDHVFIDLLLAEAVMLHARRLVNGCPDTVNSVRLENLNLRKIACGLMAVCKK